MSKINMLSRTRDLTKQVLGNPGRRQQMMGRNIPGRGAPGGITSASLFSRAKDIPQQKLAKIAGVSSALGAASSGGLLLNNFEPEEIGAAIANMKLGFNEGMQMLRQKAADFAKVPQVYFLKLEQGYKDEMRKQQEMQNIQEFADPMGAPEELAPTIEEQAIQPVSLFMAEGDEVVRFEDRPPSMQIFSLQTSIDNLMTEYEMAVRNKEFARAQKIADEIDQIEQQKIAINSKMIGMKDGDEVKKEFPNPGLKALYESGEKGRDAVEAMGYQAGDEVKQGLFSEQNNRIQQLYSGATDAELGMLGQIQRTDIIPGTPEDIEKRIYLLEKEIANQFKEYHNALEGGFKEQAAAKQQALQKMMDQRLELKNEYANQFNSNKAKGMAEGGEAIDDDLESIQMSEEDAMNEMNQLAQSPEVQMIEQLIGVVQQLIAQGVSEEEIKMFLKEQGLDDEDIEALFQMIAESGMQQEQGANIDQQLQSIM